MITETSPTDRKYLARWLDRAAQRAELIEARPASAKQVWYLAGLMAERSYGLDWAGCGVLDTQAILTSREASRLIDECLGKVAA